MTMAESMGVAQNPRHPPHDILPTLLAFSLRALLAFPHLCGYVSYLKFQAMVIVSRGS